MSHPLNTPDGTGFWKLFITGNIRGYRLAKILYCLEMLVSWSMLTILFWCRASKWSRMHGVLKKIIDEKWNCTGRSCFWEQPTCPDSIHVIWGEVLNVSPSPAIKKAGAAESELGGFYCSGPIPTSRFSPWRLLNPLQGKEGKARYGYELAETILTRGKDSHRNRARPEREEYFGKKSNRKDEAIEIQKTAVVGNNSDLVCLIEMVVK